MSRIITRAEWGARHRDGFSNRSIAAINQWWLHGSVTVSPGPNATFEADARAVRIIEDIGQSRFGGGMSYSYLVSEAGRVFEGHSLGRVGAHTAGHNTKGVGICLIGNYDTSEPSEAQLRAVAWLLQHLGNKRLTGGHRDVKSTACPGRFAYAKIAYINSLAGGGAPVSAPTPSVPSAPITPNVKTNADGSLTLSRDGRRGPATIGRWQEVLGTPIDFKISKPVSTLMAKDQNFLNSVVAAPHILNLTGKNRLDEDGREGPKTIKVRQFWLYNNYGPAVLGRGATASDFDGIDGKQTTGLHQYALNLATAGSGRY